MRHDHVPRDIGDVIQKHGQRLDRLERRPVASTVPVTEVPGVPTFVQGTEPVEDLVDGALWIDTNDGSKLYRYNLATTTWVLIGDTGVTRAQVDLSLSLMAGFDTEARLDNAASAWYRSTAPTATGAGDLWVDSDDRKLYRWSGTAWVDQDNTSVGALMQASSNAVSIADAVVRAWFQFDAPVAEGIGDLWVDTNDQDRLYRWDGRDWVDIGFAGDGDWVLDRDRLIDKAAADAASALGQLTSLSTEMQEVRDIAEGAIRTFYQADPPWPDLSAQPADSVGDLWLDTDTEVAYRWDGSNWVVVPDSGLSLALREARDAREVADGKITTYYSPISTLPTPADPDGFADGDLWIVTNEGNRIRRWDAELATPAWVDLPVGPLALEPALADNIDQSIHSYVVEYAVNTSETVAPTTGWSTATPTRDPGTYIWFRTTVTHNDGTSTTTNPALLTGNDGTNAPTIYLTATSQVLTSPAAGGATTPATVTVTGAAVNTTISVWQYSVDGGTFSTTVPAGVSRTGNVVTVTGSTMTARTIAVRMADSAGVADTLTVAKVREGATGGSGAAGADAYTVLLTNESHTFAGGTSAALAGNVTSRVVAYKGATQVAATIGVIPAQPTGMTVAVANNGTTTAEFTVTVTTSLTQQSGTFTVPVTVDGLTFNQTFSWAVTRAGQAGANAATVSLTATTQALTSPAAGGATTPATATVTGTATNTTITVWQYSVDGATFSTSVPAGVSRTGNVVTVTGSTMTAKTIAVRMADAAGVADTLTVAKMFNGATGGAGADAYTVLLTNEAHTFSGSTTAALAGSTTSQVLAYKGATQIAATIGTITGQVTGLTTSITNNSTTTATFTITVTTALTQQSGELTVPLTVDGKSFTKKFSWAVSRAGVKGDTGDTGSAGLVWRGVWAAATAYAVNDAVSYQGYSYRRLVAGPGRNLLANPSFSTNANGWSPVRCTEEWDSVQEAGKYTVSDDTGSGIGSVRAAVSPNPSGEPGKTYHCSVEMWSDTASGLLSRALRMVWRRADGTQIGGALDQIAYASAPGEKVRLTLSGIAPAETASYNFWVGPDGAEETNGDIFWIGRAITGEGPYMGYGDGESPGWQWDATPHASTSTAVTPPPQDTTNWAPLAAPPSAPTSSPTPEPIGVPGSILVRLPPPTDANVGGVVDVYVSTTSPVDINNSANFHGTSTAGAIYTINEMPNGDSLRYYEPAPDPVPEGYDPIPEVYYIVARARNISGSAPDPSPEIAAQMRQITSPDVSVDAVWAGTVEAGHITSGTTEAQIVLAGTIESHNAAGPEFGRVGLSAASGFYSRGPAPSISLTLQTTVGSTTITATNYTFSSSDVGRRIVAKDVLPSTTIASVTAGSGTAVVADAATATASAAIATMITGSQDEASILVHFPVDGAPNIVSGILEANKLTVTGGATFRAVTSLEPESSLIFEQGTGPPKVEPSVIVGYQEVTVGIPDGETVRGLTHTSATEDNRWYCTTWSSSEQVGRIRAFEADGKLGWSITYTAGYEPFGIVYGTGRMWVLSRRQSNLNWYVQRLSYVPGSWWGTGWGPKVSIGGYSSTLTLGWDWLYNKPLTAYSDWDGRYVNGTIWTPNASGDFVIEDQSQELGVDYGANSANWYGDDLGFASRGSFDYGSADSFVFRRIAKTNFEPFQVWTALGTVSHLTNDEWPAASTVRGGWWDGSNFWSMHNSVLTKYEGGRAMWGSGTSDRWSFDYRWFDSETTRGITVSTTSSSPLITASNYVFGTGDIGVGISGSGIPAGATLSSVTAGTGNATMTVNATATASSVAATLTSIQHETLPSPRYSFSMTKRARVTVTISSVPVGRNGVNDPDSARLYWGRGSTDADTVMVREKTMPLGTVTYTMNPAAASEGGTVAAAFGNSTPSELRTSGGGVWINGAGDGDVGTAGFRASVREESRFAGEVTMWATSSPPTGWLVCNGTIYNISQYPELGALLGAQFGGDGVNTFAVPDLRSRFPIGAGTFAALGGSDGKTTESNRTPRHTHSTPNTVSTDGSHDHNASGLSTNTANHGGDNNTGGGGNLARITAIGGGNYTQGHSHNVTGRTGIDGAHSHPLPDTNQSATNAIPYAALNFIIKT